MELCILYHKLERLFNALPVAAPVVQRRPARTCPKKRWTDAEDTQLRQWYGEGVTLKEIGLRFGVDYYAVMQRARRPGPPK
jgi:hypothetical protein